MSLDDFKRFIIQKWNIPWDQLLILLPFGNKLKASSFKDCLSNTAIGANEFYVYDRRLFSVINEPVYPQHDMSSNPELAEKVESLLHLLTRDIQSKNECTLFKPISSPLEDVDLKLENLSHRTIISLLTTNLGWLSALEIDVHYFRKMIQEYLSQTSSIFKCLSICEQYLKLYCYDVEKLYNSNVQFLNQLADDTSSKKWKDCYNNTLLRLDGLNGTLEQYVHREMLEENEMKLILLDQTIDNKLKKIRQELDFNAELRNKVTKSVESIQKEFAPGSIKDRFEKVMLDKFDELVQDTRSTSRAILEQDFAETQNSDLENAQQYLESIKNGVARKLLTIANAVYAQIELVLEQRGSLQKRAIITLGEIAFVQMETLGIKKILLDDCNKELDVYQKLELELSQVESLPFIYGLYLIECYRRQIWCTLVTKSIIKCSKELKDVLEKEKISRSRWIEKFGSVASIFSNSLDDLSDLHQLAKSFDETSYFQTTSQEYSTSSEDTKQFTLQVIEKYMKQMKELNVSTEITDILWQNFYEANSLSLELYMNDKEPSDSPRTMTAGHQINGYRARIKKLESLLHDVKYSDPSRWPSGILNSNYMQPFHNSITTIGARAKLCDSNNSYNVMEMQLKIKNLQELAYQSNKTNDTKDLQLSAVNAKVADLEIENAAFKENLSHLKKELARLAVVEEEKQSYILLQQKSFKSDIQSVIKENTSLVGELTSISENFRNVQDERDNLLLEFRRLKEKSVKQMDAFTSEGDKLTERNKQLENSMAGLRKTNEELASKNTKAVYVDEATQTVEEPIEQSSLISNSHDMKDLLKRIEARTFEVFKSDVFILENIGLLLAFDEEGFIKIKRVKGLKKDQNASILDESTQIPENDTVLKSSVFRGIKQLYNELQIKPESDKHNDFLFRLNKVYDDKLFENAVIGRFKDIEFLAKKLTKENKRKKGLLETYQKERLALNNFQVGDLALFLPTRETISSCESSESSLISSFSSVDLSTPPPLDASIAVASSGGRKEKSAKARRNPPWAAFTAFEDNTRYFLKDENGLTKGREWFVGRILNLESNVVDRQNYNPYKLPQGTVWFHLSATMISLSG